VISRTTSLSNANAMLFGLRVDQLITAEGIMASVQRPVGRNRQNVAAQQL